jgi:protein-disulfide isomerase/uncharacterized membrane protein
MERSHFTWSTLLRLASVIALAASAALLADYSNAVASFCAEGSGCAAVKASSYASLMGVPTPVVGLLGFTALLTVSLAGGRLARLLLLPAAGVGAVGAVAFIGLQLLVIHQLCWLCMTVDISALFALLGAWGYRRQQREDGLRLPAWGVIALLAVVAPLFWPRVRPQPPVPPQLQALYVPGKVTLVEFSDFECPFCRLLHQRLKELLPPYGDRVVLRRLHKPLPMHKNARDAARGALCAEDQGKTDEMADLLFSSHDLSPDGVRGHAQSLQLDLELFDRCVSAAQTDARIDAQAALIEQVGFKGLPTTFIGDRAILGVQEAYVFQQAIERAERGEGREGIPGWLYLSTTLGLLGLVVALGWRRGALPSAATE